MFVLKHYDELSKAELYNLLRLRAEVFVVEQKCAFHELDNIDQVSFHLMDIEPDGKIVGICRIIPPQKLYTECSIGRVAVDITNRQTGLGKKLMQKAVDICTEKYDGPIKIMAQLYLEKFYAGFGFVTNSEPFLEDDILHIYMVKGS